MLLVKGLGDCLQPLLHLHLCLSAGLDQTVAVVGFVFDLRRRRGTCLPRQRSHDLLQCAELLVEFDSKTINLAHFSFQLLPDPSAESFLCYSSGFSSLVPLHLPHKTNGSIEKIHLAETYTLCGSSIVIVVVHSRLPNLLHKNLVQVQRQLLAGICDDLSLAQEAVFVSVISLKYGLHVFRLLVRESSPQRLLFCTCRFLNQGFASPLTLVDSLQELGQSLLCLCRDHYLDSRSNWNWRRR
mmetsp:Transcript_66266/g.155989  ORF Transcript_66266/g.155989 Transcript_66266/m.155989 type:complete len:241 (+) Transcript_66266:1078-1800(+)